MEKTSRNQDERAVVARQARQTILLLASRQAMYQSLAETMRQHFGSCEVTLAEGWGRMATPSTHLDLVLVSARTASGSAIEELADFVRKHAPGVPIGLLIEDDLDLDLDLDELAASGSIQGILPLSLPLEVLIAITSLLLAGGKYLPQDSSRMSIAPAPVMHLAAAADAPVEVALSVAEPTALTTREEQILQYLSEGFQNKLIANRMALSEHTVKAHVHRVIAKLGVSNRTQAAAAFLRRKSGGGRGSVASRFEARQS